MVTFFEYIKKLNESRYLTHGVQHVKRTLPRFLSKYGMSHELDINKLTDDFQLYIYNNNQFTKEKLYLIIGICESLGYFPSTMMVDKLSIFDDFKKYKHHKQVINNDKSYIDFIDYLKIVIIPESFKEIYIQFESYQDKDLAISEIPDTMYYVYNNSNRDKIQRYGIVPKSKSKISYHPERVYVTFSVDDAERFIKQLDDGYEYSILKIVTDDELKSYIKLKKYPNFDAGFYTNQNISPMYLEFM